MSLPIKNIPMVFCSLEDIIFQKIAVSSDKTSDYGQAHETHIYHISILRSQWRKYPCVT